MEAQRKVHVITEIEGGHSEAKRHPSRGINLADTLMSNL